MKDVDCVDEVAIFCEKIARQLRFVAIGLESGEDNGSGVIVGGGSDILTLLADQCSAFATEFGSASKQCGCCKDRKEFFKIADSA